MNIKSLFRVIRHLPKTLYFNFHYLSFSDALKLPVIFVSKVHLAEMKGSVNFSSPIKTAMVVVGSKGNVLYRQDASSCVWANYGGNVTFGNKVEFCDGIALEIGQQGLLSFGNNIYFGPMVRMACYDSIEIGSNSRIAWESIILDTDFHSTIDINTGKHSALTKPVKIGKNNWIGIRSFVMKGTQTPDFCIASGYSVINKKYDIPNYSLIGGIPAKFLKEGLYRDLRSHVNTDAQKKYDIADSKQNP